MKAITTRYLGPTNYKGSRVVADDGDGNRITLGWQHAPNSDDNHAHAARALCQSMGWSGTLTAGTVLRAGQKDRLVWVWSTGKRIRVGKPIQAATE